MHDEQRKIKMALYRHDYALMLHLAATGNYVGAARLALVKYDPAKHDYQGEPGVLLHDVTAGRRATYRR